jgi:hypothetical protein
MKDVIRYSEAFKLMLAEEATAGKYRSLNEAVAGTGFADARHWGSG